MIIKFTTTFTISMSDDFIMSYQVRIINLKKKSLKYRETSDSLKSEIEVV